MDISRPLRAGDMIRFIPDGEECVIRYVNASGAYAVPLAGLRREIKGKQVEFQAPGRMISATSLVELIGCMEVEEGGKMGKKGKGKVKAGRAGGKVEPKDGEGDSHQLLREVMQEAEKEIAEQDAVKGEPASSKPRRVRADEGEVKAAPLGSFSYDPPQRAVADSTADAGGHPAAASDSSAYSEAKMAKKAQLKAVKPKGNGQVRAKAPKGNRKCVCGCGSDTGGFFAPGHDSRFHAWIDKLADGRMDPKDVPAAVRNGLNLQQTKSGWRAQSPHYYRNQ